MLFLKMLFYSLQKIYQQLFLRLLIYKINNHIFINKEYKVKPVLVDRENIVTETIKLSVLDEAIIIPPTPPYPPITGDNFPIFIFLVVLIIGTCGSVYYICSKKFNK